MVRKKFVKCQYLKLCRRKSNSLAEYVAKQTSASSVTSEAMDPVTSASESATKSTTTGTGTTANEQDKEKTTMLKRGGMVRGQGIAIRGTKFKGVF